jgi:hypothetical protein
MLLRRLLLVIFGFGLLYGPANAKDLTPEVVSKCKHATALVFLEDEARGTAFHIGNGLFITNNHLLRDATSTTKVSLMLDPGETTQRTVIATVLRQNKDLDLALFRVKEAKLPPGLDLGLISSVTETTSVTAFGYPYGSDLALTSDTFPNVTVSMGHITALRKDQGKVREVQVDASLNPGNSGGPLVTNAGLVIGVVRAGIVGTGLSFALPVDDVRQFLFGPAISLTAPEFSSAVPGKPNSFTIDILSNPPGADSTLDLVLSTDPLERRVYRATPVGKTHYTVSAPLLQEIEAGVLVATVDQDNSTFSIRIKDRQIMVAGRSMRLTAIREITLGAAPSVVTASGQTIAGTAAGLNSVPRTGGPTAGVIDLSRAYKISLQAVDPRVQSVRYGVIIRTGGKVVQQNGAIDKEGIHPDLLLDQQEADAPEPEAGPRRIEVIIDDAKYIRGPRSETITAVFNRPDGGVTRALYKGYVLVTVKGYGISYNDDSVNDAFYLFTGLFKDHPQNGHDGGFYQLTFSTQPIESRALGSNAIHSILGGVPAYNPLHEYTFVLDTKTDTFSNLHFGVSDGGFDENRGAFVITVSQLVPTK